MGEWKIVVCAFVFGVLLMQVDAQEGSTCFTPDDLPGICVNIYSCDPLISLLRSNNRNARVIRYLQESACGFIGSKPLVCCARKAQPQPQPQPIQTVPPPFFPTAAPRTTERVTERSTTTERSQGREDIDGDNRENGGNGEGRYQLPRWPYCGLRNESQNVRVVGGRPAVLGEFPWIVALGYRNQKNVNNPKWLCGGSLITEKHVLTAGHCLRPDLYLVRAGDLDLYSDDDGALPINIPIARAIRHEDYNGQLHTNDIAVLILSRPAKGYLIAPVCLPIDEPLRSKTFERYIPNVAGWGSIYFRGPSSAHLQVVQLPVVSLQTCAASYAGIRGATIDDRVLCSGDSAEKKDSCEGDSGGPLIISHREGVHMQMFQIGVVSYGHRCAEPGFPGVYTRVTKFVDWIQNNLYDA